MQKALSKNIINRTVFLSECDFYIPSYGSPASFMAVPVYSITNKKIGVLAVQIPQDRIQQVMTDHRNWQQFGMGNTGESYLVSEQGYMYSDSRFLIQNKPLFLEKLRKAGMLEKLLKRVESLNTSVMLQHIPVLAYKSVPQISWTKNYLGEEVLRVYLPLELYNNYWGVVTEKSKREIFQPLEVFQLVIPAMLIALVVLSVILSNWQSKLLVTPIRHLKNHLESLSMGSIVELSVNHSKDELGDLSKALYKLQEYLKRATAFANNIGKGIFDDAFTPAAENDVLGKALVTMKDELKSAEQARQIQNYIQTGVSECNKILLSSDTDLQQLLDNVLSYAVKYTHSHQGSIYLLESDYSNSFLQLKSAYANHRKKHIENKIALGEGLVGQCFLEKEASYLVEIPDNYTPIISGLGFRKPQSILVCPIAYNNEVVGVLEISSLKEIGNEKIECIKQICGLLASTLTKEISNMKMKEILQKNDEMLEQLRAQEEVLRQNLAEMMTTQEQFKRAQLSANVGN